jgi:hypothetical protein
MTPGMMKAVVASHVCGVSMCAFSAENKNALGVDTIARKSAQQSSL